MSLKGSFEEFSLSDIIQLIHLQKKGGRLTVEDGHNAWVLGFEKGRLVQAHVQSRGLPRLGEILVRQGLMDRETLSEALREQEKTPRHLGEVLEDMGLVECDQIASALTLQIQETAMNLFFLTHGRYKFERVPVTYDTQYVTPINTEYILMEGARRVDEWPAIQRKVGGGDAIFAAIKRPAEDGGGLSEQEQDILELVDGERDVMHICLGLGIGLFDVCRVISGLMANGWVQMAQPGDSPLQDPISCTVLAVGKTAGPTVTESVMVAASEDDLEPVVMVPWLWVGIGSALAFLSLAVWNAMRGQIS